ncbi:Sec-independent protein translocase subunit TatB [Pigmentiphaga aceris]|uniref:Sec-independent protein translocase protein TatB n=1 Tax=Pigmentiphaga aceris TaxID=1940612 RepID=A0A5C0AVF4_9BURK|nr:Sec-independent protein translocase protein TatB [Pigmentiphaga aceris]QEI04900.1 Sec-independent protein translocase subunit TatB [Pigmentiphaga aceris]
MFDVGFSELMVVGVVALVVIGPERLPKVAKTVGHLLGRAQRYVSDVKGDIQREFELDELRKMRTEMEATARSFETSVATGVNDFQSKVEDTARSIESSVNDLGKDGTVTTDASSIGEVVPRPELHEPAPTIHSPASVSASHASPASHSLPPVVPGTSHALPARASAADVMARALRDRTAIGPDRLS